MKTKFDITRLDSFNAIMARAEADLPPGASWPGRPDDIGQWADFLEPNELQVLAGEFAVARGLCAAELKIAGGRPAIGRSAEANALNKQFAVAAAPVLPTVRHRQDATIVLLSIIAKLRGYRA